MIWCLSNARSGDLQFGTSFIALRALVREITPNTIPTHPHTHIHDPSRISIDCLTPASRLGAQPPSEKYTDMQVNRCPYDTPDDHTSSPKENLMFIQQTAQEGAVVPVTPLVTPLVPTATSQQSLTTD